MMKSSPCSVCSFELWHLVFENDTVQVGLYNDARFPGRLLVSLRDHYDHLDEVPEGLALVLTREVQRLSRLLREALEVPRINAAVLGNAVSHVHAHLIPRRASDSDPEKAPWEDSRERSELDPTDFNVLLTLLREKLTP